MSRRLDARIAFRLPILIAGVMLASGRRTASNWFRNGKVKDDWDRFYALLGSLGSSVVPLMLPLAGAIVRRFDPGEGGYWKMAIDDSPTGRYGPCVEGANVHRNPTPEPAGSRWLYGHNWVCLAVLVRHSFGVTALPLLSLLYVRKADVPRLDPRYDWKFRTKHELALTLARRVIAALRATGSRAGFLVVFDGAYVARELIRPLVASGVVVVSRLRKDAALFDLPTNRPGQPGRPRIYGKNQISLVSRARRRNDWPTIEYDCRGVKVRRRYRTFPATSRVTGGVIRVVLLEFPGRNWAAYFSTDESMSAEAILQTVSERWAIEEQFHDVKEVWGAGQQQVRNIWSNIGCWNLCTWLYTLVELECHDAPADELVDRSDRPWDDPDRRPSHADRRRRIAREMLRNEFLSDLPPGPETRKIRARFESLLALAT